MADDGTVDLTDKEKYDIAYKKLRAFYRKFDRAYRAAERYAKLAEEMDIAKEIKAKHFILPHDILLHALVDSKLALLRDDLNDKDLDRGPVRRAAQQVYSELPSTKAFFAKCKKGNDLPAE